MTITFNDIPILGGFKRPEVKILRHGTVGEPKTYDTWRNDRHAFEGYQARQGRSEIPESGYIASFVVSRGDKTTFAGMYASRGSSLAPLGDIDPLTGQVNVDGRRRIYDLTPVPGREGYEGRLVIAWPTGSAGRRWHRRADSMLSHTKGFPC